LDEPAGFTGEAMDNGYAANSFRRGKWGPPLSEELETPGVSDVFGIVGDLVFGVEFRGGKGPEWALIVGFCHWVLHHFFIFLWSVGGCPRGGV
jgi:hypothetical protein